MNSHVQQIEIQNFKASRNFFLNLIGRNLLLYRPNAHDGTSRIFVDHRRKRSKCFDFDSNREPDQNQDRFRTLFRKLVTAKTRVHELEITT